MAKHRFKVKEGIHVDAATGKTYSAGQIVESDHDLSKTFRGKFDKLESSQPGQPNPVPAAGTLPSGASTSGGQATQASVPADSNQQQFVSDAVPGSGSQSTAPQVLQAPSKDDDENDFEDAADKDDDTSKAPAAALGTDVTDKFPHAKENDFNVYKRNGKFFVYDADDMSKPLNADGVAVGRGQTAPVDSIVDTALGKNK